jgi:hypothetical protein
MIQMNSLFDAEIRNQLVERVRGVSPDAKPRWGKMNVNQMICHCTDQFRTALGERNSKPVGGAFRQSIMKYLAVYVLPLPKNVPTLPEIDQVAGGGTKPTEFESDRKLLANYIERFVNAPKDFAWNRHGAFGELTGEQWAILAYKHLDHHLKQFGA